MTRKRSRSRTRQRKHQPARSNNWKILLGVIIGVAPILLFGGVDRVTAEVQAVATSDSTPAIQSNESFVIERKDAVYLNRIFNERTHEIGYCLGIDGNQLSLWLADTVEASAKSLEMKTSNCPPDMQAGTAHTHLNGRVGLSEQDRQTLLNREPGIMCIHAGEVDIAPGATLDNLVCYKETQTGDTMAIRTRIASQSG